MGYARPFPALWRVVESYGWLIGLENDESPRLRHKSTSNANPSLKHPPSEQVQPNHLRSPVCHPASAYTPASLAIPQAESPSLPRFAVRTKSWLHPVRANSEGLEPEVSSLA